MSQKQCVLAPLRRSVELFSRGHVHARLQGHRLPRELLLIAKDGLRANVGRLERLPGGYQRLQQVHGC